jgi:hypothetical protein
LLRGRCALGVGLGIAGFSLSLTLSVISFVSFPAQRGASAGSPHAALAALGPGRSGSLLLACRTGALGVHEGIDAITNRAPPARGAAS